MVAPRHKFGLRLAAAPMLLAGAMTLLVSGTAAAAAPSQKDLQIIGRVLGFLDPPLGGEVTVGIVSDGDPAAAQATADLMSSGLKAGNVTLVPKLVDTAGAAAAGVQVLLVPAPAAAGAQVVSAMAGKKTLVVSTDPACVDAGTCVMSVQSEPSVEIVMNRAKAQETGISLGSAFRMMIKER